MSLLELFCDVDDFLLSFTPQWKAAQPATGRRRERAGQFCPSEVMTILIHFHQSHYRTFKAYYTEYVQVHLTNEFPRLVGYTRFVALIPGVMVPMLAYLQSRFGACTGISFIDSTSLKECDPKRIHGHLYWLLGISVPKKRAHAGSTDSFSLQSTHQIGDLGILA